MTALPRRRSPVNWRPIASFLALLAVAGPANAAMTFVDNLAGNADFSEPVRKIARAAQQAWSDTFSNNNRQDGTNKFTVSWEMSDTLAGSTLAVATDYDDDDTGIPIAATIRINSDILGGDEFFLDATPAANEEFTRPDAAAFPNHYVAKPAAVDPISDELVSTLYDLYSTLLHEVGHAIGFAASYSKFSARLTAANAQGIRNYEFASNDDVSVLVDQSTGTHIHPEQDATFKGAAYSQEHALMTPTEHPGERVLIDELTIAILKDAYGYSMDMVPEPATGMLAFVALLATLRTTSVNYRRNR